VSDKVAAAVVDFANALEAACVQLKRYIGEQQTLGVKEETFTKLLGWEETRGDRLGEYETTSRKANNNSDAFNHALNILKRNNATISSRFHDEGYKYSFWLYEKKPDTIYRQLLKKKKEETPTALVEKPREQGEAVEKVRQYFPKALEALLIFEETGNYIMIKPRQYLGSENFSKIAAIVREANGEYISAGKESHFRIPIKK